LPAQDVSQQPIKNCDVSVFQYCSLRLWLVLIIIVSSIRPKKASTTALNRAVMPRAAIDCDHVHLSGVRNFQYRSRNNFTVGYQERDVLLSHLVALDFYVSYFTEGPVGHTFLSFIFDNAAAAKMSSRLILSYRAYKR
jgi:hypothetical protein